MKTIDYNKIFEKKRKVKLPIKCKEESVNIFDREISEEYWRIIQFYAGIYIKEEICFKPEKSSPLTNQYGYNRINKFIEPESIKRLLSQYEEQIPKGNIPIAEIDGGNFLCINQKTGYVYIWVHDAAIGADLFLADKSFGKFMEKLEIVDLEETEDKNIVVSSDIDDSFFDLL